MLKDIIFVFDCNLDFTKIVLYTKYNLHEKVLLYRKQPILNNNSN